jgi:hypothetical protein
MTAAKDDVLQNILAHKVTVTATLMMIVKDPLGKNVKQIFA